MPDYFKLPPGEKPVIRFLGDAPGFDYAHHTTNNVLAHEVGTVSGCPLCIAHLDKLDVDTAVANA